MSDKVTRIDDTKVEVETTNTREVLKEDVLREKRAVEDIIAHEQDRLAELNAMLTNFSAR